MNHPTLRIRTFEAGDERPLREVFHSSIHTHAAADHSPAQLSAWSPTVVDAALEIAIALRSVGFVAKLLYEAIEEIDRAPVEAIVSTGAPRAAVVAYGIVPQILPAFAGIAVFRWDINIRESTVLGLVGAGGIGLQLEASLNTLAWPQVSVILLAILSTVVVGEWVSAKVRHAII